MTPEPRIVLTDANVLINFAASRRLALLGELHDLRFAVPSEALAEILRPEQRRSVEDAIQSAALQEMSLSTVAHYQIFADLRRRLGLGESACLALASGYDGLVASDEKRLFLREADRLLGPNRVLNTPGLLLLALRQGLISLEEADEIKEELEGSRFRMTFQSFRELL